MKRYKAYDPPEYVQWTLDEDVLAEFEARIQADPERAALIEALDRDALVDLYRAMVSARLHDVALKRWVKRGVLSKAWLATGEEAVTIGAVAALRKGEGGDVVGPMIRNASACIEMGLPLEQMFGAYLASASTPCKGRDLHIGDLSYGIVAPISHVGSLQPVMVGTALAFKMQRAERVAVTWIGDGATKTGEFHEGASFAAANGVPLVTIIQNNQVALGTRTDAHHVGDFNAWPAAYGMRGAEVDGNNVLDVYAGMRQAVDHARAGDGPTLMVATTFRMGGHATHDEAEARHIFDQETFDRWGKRDPIGVYEAWLARRPYALDGADPAPDDLIAHNLAVLADIEAQVDAQMEAASEAALAKRDSDAPDPATLLDGIYAT